MIQRICRQWRRASSSMSFSNTIDSHGSGPLSQERKAGRKRICKITGDRKLCAKMASMGVFPGEEIDILCADKNAQCILRAAGCTISLDAAVSEHIFVESV